MNEDNNMLLKEARKLSRSAKFNADTVWLNLDEKIKSEECIVPLRDQLIVTQNELWNIRQDLESIIERISDITNH